MGKTLKYLLYLCPLALVTGLVWVKHTSYFDLAQHKAFYNTVSYSDLLLNGKTKIERFPIVDEIVSFEYTLDTGAKYPYCGVGLNPKAPNRFFDLAPYDLLDLEIHATKGKRIVLQLAVLQAGLSDSETEQPHRVLIYELDLLQNQTRYTIPLSEFKTPTWWHENFKIPVDKLSKPDFSKTRSINIQNCVLIGLHKTDLITVNRLVFRQDVWKHWPYYLLALVFYYSGLVYLSRKPKDSPVLAQQPKISFQEKLPLQNQVDKDLHKLISFLGNNYSNAELSIPMVQKETGVGESKISALLKSEFGTNFKQYLTEIRLNEAKRLLTDTDLQISEIAYAVGFGNVSHFNRVFKAETQQSPSSYRAKGV